MDIVTLSHGSGGINSAHFIQNIFMPFFQDMMPFANEDSGIFRANDNNEKYVTSTDSYTINPIFFEGGDIGKLCVCGSANDVAMMGGKPTYLNIAFIIEEGFKIQELKKIIESIACECKKLDLQILAADTKVLPTFNKDLEKKNIFINTTCIGMLEKVNISAASIQHEDCIILSGKIGNHGARIFLEQNNIALESAIKSDCASLYPMLSKLFASEIPLHALRDATRGGLASVLNEWAISSKVCIEVNEEYINIDEEVRGVCEILGLEAYDLANEGVCVLALPQEYATQAITILQEHELGKYAKIIGKAIQKDIINNLKLAHSSMQDSETLEKMYLQRVVLQTKYGSKRFLEYPQGELLPRIC
ncbi:hydrogenase expression/formation protein HypE [Helicobacter didelphidarum]|uniref:Hydrogenase expression/formation protein HypE n=1 Tax=Helicobacter didelphidarum TaxID=2040648 RepID=A0A3D8INC1_9HELI|nr:hydrogenase expression/formation protein HypE [Helicobacter didelphidarum]RDU66071.1 hydrogenase expression/formation protein HypE [Helicobacter didelphidarum]